MGWSTRSAEAAKERSTQTLSQAWRRTTKATPLIEHDLGKPCGASERVGLTEQAVAQRRDEGGQTPAHNSRTQAACQNPLFATRSPPHEHARSRQRSPGETICAESPARGRAASHGLAHKTWIDTKCGLGLSQTDMGQGATRHGHMMPVHACETPREQMHRGPRNTRPPMLKLDAYLYSLLQNLVLFRTGPDSSMPIWVGQKPAIPRRLRQHRKLGPGFVELHHCRDGLAGLSGKRQ